MIQDIARMNQRPGRGSRALLKSEGSLLSGDESACGING